MQMCPALPTPPVVPNRSKAVRYGQGRGARYGGGRGVTGQSRGRGHAGMAKVRGHWVRGLGDGAGQRVKNRKTMGCRASMYVTCRNSHVKK